MSWQKNKLQFEHPRPPRLPLSHQSYCLKYTEYGVFSFKPPTPDHSYYTSISIKHGWFACIRNWYPPCVKPVDCWGFGSSSALYRWFRGFTAPAVCNKPGNFHVSTHFSKNVLCSLSIAADQWKLTPCCLVRYMPLRETAWPRWYCLLSRKFGKILAFLQGLIAFLDCEISNNKSSSITSFSALEMTDLRPLTLGWSTFNHFRHLIIYGDWMPLPQCKATEVE